MAKSKKIVYRIYDDKEEKHYVLTSFSHKELEELLEKYKKRKDKVIAKDFVKYIRRKDETAEEVAVHDFYF